MTGSTKQVSPSIGDLPSKCRSADVRTANNRVAQFLEAWQLKFQFPTFHLDGVLAPKQLKVPKRRVTLGARRAKPSRVLFGDMRCHATCTEIGEDHGSVEARPWCAWHHGWRYGEEIGGANDCETT